METKHKKALQRLEYVFGGFVGLGTLMCCALLPLSNAAGSGKEWKEQAKQQKKDEIEAVEMKAAVMGDIYDRNGEVIVSVAGEGKPAVYRDDRAYSSTIGFCGEEMGSHLLMDNFQADLFWADGGTDKGRSLTLTLDANIQEYAAELISQGEGERGSVTVLDAKDGAVAAMAFRESFSMDQLRRLSGENIENLPWNKLLFGESDGGEDNTGASMAKPLSMPTRPGSIFKVLTGIGILENNLQDVTIDDNGQGVYQMEGGEIKNANGGVYGALDFKDGFINSSNIYFGRMTMEHLGWDTMEGLAKRAKVGDILSCDFGTVFSTFESQAGEGYDKSRPNLSLAKIGFGYGDVQLTGVHAGMIAQGIANGGVMCEPYMLSAVNQTDGYETGKGKYRYKKGREVVSRSYYYNKEKEPGELTDARTAQAMTETMVEAYKSLEANHEDETITTDGLLIDGEVYPVALKTGTADIDEEGTNNIWMVSFAPADDPRYVVAVNRYGVKNQYGANLFMDTVSMYRELFGENKGG